MKYVFLILALGVVSCQQKREQVRPRIIPLTEGVFASGNIVPRHEYRVFALADGYLANQRVSEGDTVSSGQPLFYLESETPQIRLRNARHNLQTAQQYAGAQSPVLEELEASLQSARARLTNDSVNYTRYKNLLAQNSTSRVQYDQAALAYQTARSEYQALLNRYRKTKVQLRNELQNARSQYQLNAEEEANYTVRSRISGRVYELYKEEGELVKRGEPVALLGDHREVLLKLSIDELDVSRVKTGQAVLVTLDSYPGQVFRAEVERIYPMLNTRDRTFRVDARFTGPLPALFAGLTAEANILIRNSPRAMAIPRSFLIGEDSVAVEQDGKTQTIRIRKGVENMEYVEVLEGLDTNSIVVKR